MAARKLTKIESYRKKRAQEVKERRLAAMEYSIRNPRSLLDGYTESKTQRRLIIESGLMPLSVLRRAHRMKGFRFDQLLTELLEAELVYADDLDGNIVLMPVQQTIHQLQQERRERRDREGWVNYKSVQPA